MDYAENVTYITLEGHIELEKYRYFYFTISLIYYVFIVCCNVVVITVIYTNKRLHEPMYIFIAALLCNALFGATAFYPKLLIDFLSETQVLSRESCLFQAFFIYTYGAAEFTLLSAMAYDRYVSICKPLQYSTIIKMSTVKKILFFCWFLPSCETGVGMILTYQLKLCRFKVNRIYCTNGAVVKLSCGDTSVKTSYGMFTFSITVFPPVIFVIFSYISILKVCLKSSKDRKRKALQTCFPHLIIFISYTCTSCFQILYGRLDPDIPQIVSILMSVENLVIPPLVNPVIYGLKVQEIFTRIKRMFFGEKVHVILNVMVSVFV